MQNEHIALATTLWTFPHYSDLHQFLYLSLDPSERPQQCSLQPTQKLRKRYPQIDLLHSVI